MKPFAWLFLSLPALLPLLAPGAAKPYPLVLRVEKGKSVTFTLPENITTGFEWTAEYDPRLCRVTIGRRGPENPGGTPRCGAPGKAVITVTLLSDAPAGIVLKYRRPWEKDTPPAKVLYYAVTPAKP